MNKEVIVLISALSLFGCGGGDSIKEPSSNTVVPPASSSADFVSESTNLHNYSDGEYISYKGRLKLRESSLFEAFDQALNVDEVFNYSNNPLRIDASPSETMTNIMSATTESGDVVSETYEFWQGYPYEGYNSKLQIYQRGGAGTCALYNNKTCFGITKIPSPIQLGTIVSQSGFEGDWNSAFNNYWKNNDVTYTAKYVAKENVTTKLGTFEAYKMEFSYQRDSLINSSEVGVYWIYPDIGIIKADYARKEYDGEVYDVSYSITNTNIAY